MKWLVTGGCGFIGSALVNNLRKEESNRIRVIDNMSVGSVDAIGNFTFLNNSSCFTDVEIMKGDILDQESMVILARGADTIVHLAALPGVRESVTEPQRFFDNNVIGTMNVLEAARVNHVDNVIFASSGSVVGDCLPPVDETKTTEPISPYGATKACGESLCHAYHHSYKMHIMSLRFSNVYGPYSTHKTSLIAKFINRAIDGKTLQIYGSGNQTRDFIYIDDLISAIKKCATIPSYGVFQLSTGVETSVNKITQKLILLLKEKGIENIRLEHIQEQLGDIQTNWADNTKFKKTFNWEPEVDLETGLWKTIDWFFKQKKRVQKSFNKDSSNEPASPKVDDLRFRRFCPDISVPKGAGQ